MIRFLFVLVTFKKKSCGSGGQSTLLIYALLAVLSTLLQHHVGIVEDYLRIEREGFSSAKGSAYLFPSKKGPRISERSLYSAVNRLLVESGAWTKQPAGPHLLLHTAASLMLADGRTLVEVKESLWHVSLLTTQRYVHLIR